MKTSLLFAARSLSCLVFAATLATCAHASVTNVAWYRLGEMVSTKCLRSARKRGNCSSLGSSFKARWRGVFLRSAFHSSSRLWRTVIASCHRAFCCSQSSTSAASGTADKLNAPKPAWSRSKRAYSRRTWLSSLRQAGLTTVVVSGSGSVPYSTKRSMA